MPLSIVPDVVSEQTVPALSPRDSARDVARLMADRNISAVVVEDEGRLVGIVTERDLSRRVVATDSVASTLRVADIMTRDPEVIAPSGTPAEALEIMERLRIRHLPVVQDDRVLGVVSIRDLQLSMSRRVVTI